MRKKIIIAITLHVLAIAFTLGIISYLSVHDTIERSLTNRLALARTIANNIEVFLNSNLNRLYDISLSGKIDMKGNDPKAQKKMLETAYKYSLFTEGVFILDKHGNEILSYPPHIEYLANLTHINYVNEVLKYGKSVISNVYTIEPSKQKVIFMMAPLWDGDGMTTGIVGGILSPTSHPINQLLQNIKVGDNSFVDIIDANEIVVASDNPSRVLGHHDRNLELGNMIKAGKTGIVECKYGYSQGFSPEKPVDRLAVAPLSVASWGIIVGQAEKEIFAPANSLWKKFIALMLIFIGTSIVLSIIMTKNIVKPLKLLISATDNIASGDLSTPVGNMGSDEILTLSKSFDAMRQRLAESLEKLEIQNVELEKRVAERTKEVIESRKKIEQLLKQIISSQEEERKRISRELHDSIIQDISACLIKIDTFKLSLEPSIPDKIDDIRNIIMKAIDNIYKVIRDMRPSILDDLGIEASIIGILNRHLKENGINYYLDIDFSLDKKLSPEDEITLFRILQEAIINITRHSNAGNVFVTIENMESHVKICMEDDGIGFDIQEVESRPFVNNRGLGILGMKERASLIGWDINIHSNSNEGTNICILIPLKDGGGFV